MSVCNTRIPPRSEPRDPCSPRHRADRQSWLTEAPLRMLMNNLDPEVAEHPQSLVVYGGIGRAARNWACYDKIVEVLTRLEGRQTLLVQSGKAGGVFRPTGCARVLIANSNLVPHWANWEHFNELEKGLMMYGQMTAGSWIYIGSQGIVQGTYETFVAGPPALRRLAQGRWILTAGLGGMGGASRWPPPWPARARCSRMPSARDPHRFPPAHPLRRQQAATSTTRCAHDRGRPAERAPPSPSACSATPPTSSPSWWRRGVTPDVVTDQTSAHDPVHGYLPRAGAWPNGAICRAPTRSRCVAAAKQSMARQVGHADFLNGRRRSTTATTSARWRWKRGQERLRLPGLRAGLYPPAVLRGHRPVPLGGAVRRPGGHLQDRRRR